MLEKTKNKITKKENLLLMCLCFCISFAVIILSFYFSGIVPFGDRTLLRHDASMQYIDLFRYYKELLSGNMSISYTLSNLLGGDTLAIFSYYLASPINLLIAFFSKDQLPLFFTLAVAIKIALSSVTLVFFLKQVFGKKINNVFAILLALSYGLMEYNISQSSNIMWLDGVVMLPLIILGVHKVITQKDIRFLTINVALAVIFNWYSAGICCMFSILWFLFEFLFVNAKEKDKTKIEENKSTSTLKVFFSQGMLYVLGMGLGVLISCFIFLPTVLTILNGKSISSVQLNGVIGLFHTLLKSYCITVHQSLANPSFYCGSVALLGFFGVFFLKKMPRTKKLIIIYTVIISVLTYYWVPLYYLYSLLNIATSHIYRFSFVTIFLIIAVAGYFYSHIEKEACKKLLIIPIVCLASLTIYNLINKFTEFKYILLTFAFLMVSAVAIYLIFNKTSLKKVLSVLLVCLLSFELCFNSSYLLANYYSDERTEFKDNYNNQMDKQIATIKENDNSDYRISQTSYRVTDAYCESLAYNFWSNASFTSCPDNSQLKFLENLGYITEGNCITIVDTSIVSADALMGVKYTLSEYPINGLILRSDLGVYNNKSVYENPYALPMAYTINKLGNTNLENLNPFEYQNALYSQLLNEDVTIFEKIEYSKSDLSNGVEYNFNIPNGNYACYGNIPFDTKVWERANLQINNNSPFEYSGWNSESVFYIPDDNNTNSNSNVKFFVDKQRIVNDAQFYALNLDTLKNATDEIKKNAIKIDDLGKGSMDFIVNAQQDCDLIISISDTAWDIKVNSKDIKSISLGDCFITIPLTQGENIISMDYNIKGLKSGIAISIVSTTIFIIYCVLDKKGKLHIHNKKSEEDK